MSVMIETSLGEFVVDLYTDDCPLACINFLKLCKMKYYNNVLFYNVQENFMVQTGDPTGEPSRSSSLHPRQHAHAWGVCADRDGERRDVSLWDHVR
jgi:peptidyl-prolyl cis-trans isomerase-like 4